MVELTKLNNPETEDYPDREGRTKPVKALKADGVERIEGRNVILEFDGKKCIHSRFCVTEAPESFVGDADGPWLYPDDTNPDELYAVGRECPSGAIRIKRKDGGREEQPPQTNLMKLWENGPLEVRANLKVNGKEDGFRRTLCRCGKSGSKPYCDGSHTEGFIASGEVEPKNDTKLESRQGDLNINPQKDGPFEVKGPVEICCHSGAVIARTKSCYLCRCGHSENKPFCDGSHEKVGFRAD